MESTQHHTNNHSQLRYPSTIASPRRSRPSSRQKVTMAGHFPSCFAKYSQKSNQVYIYEALSNHKLRNFGGKNLNTELASVDCTDSFESRVDFFIIFSACFGATRGFATIPNQTYDSDSKLKACEYHSRFVCFVHRNLIVAPRCTGVYVCIFI